MGPKDSEGENNSVTIANEGEERSKSFSDLGVCEQLADACDALGWKIPTAIQVNAIPLALADRLLNLDFEAEVDEILKVVPKERRTYLFSATMTTKVAKLQRACLQNPAKVEVSLNYSTVDTLKQEYIFCPAQHKKTCLNTELPGDGRLHGGRRSRSSSLYLSGRFVPECWRWTKKVDRRGGGGSSVRAQARSGSSAMVAKEMERMAAKEALLLSIKDAGGFKGLSDPAANDKAQIDVNEKILNLARLNRTPRPTTWHILPRATHFIFG